MIKLPRIITWNEESRRILDRLVKDGRTWTNDNHIPRLFAQRYPELHRQEYLDIPPRKKGRTWFVTFPNTRIKPLKKGVYEFYKIW